MEFHNHRSGTVTPRSGDPINLVQLYALLALHRQQPGFYKLDWTVTLRSFLQIQDSYVDASASGSVCCLADGPWPPACSPPAQGGVRDQLPDPPWWRYAGNFVPGVSEFRLLLLHDFTNVGCFLHQLGHVHGTDFHGVCVSQR